MPSMTDDEDDRILEEVLAQATPRIPEVAKQAGEMLTTILTRVEQDPVDDDYPDYAALCQHPAD